MATPTELSPPAALDGLQQLPVTVLHGVGPGYAERLSKLGIRTVQDALLHLPARYQDRTRIHPISSLAPGNQVLVEGLVESSQVRIGRRRSLLVRLADASGGMLLRFFHFSAAQREGLAPGMRLRCFGEARLGPAGVEMIHPEYQRLAEGETPFLDAQLTPVYPTTEGVTQPALRRVVAKALALMDDHSDKLVEWLPPELLAGLRLPGLEEAVCYLHRPPADAPQALLADGSHPAQRRLAFEELLAHQISLRKLRRRRKRQASPPLQGKGRLSSVLLERLPFSLTPAQHRVVQEIRSDLVRDHPMARLVQGDVGSGKTVVAALAALQAVEAGYQVALMAPTELLAEQHLGSFREWLAPLEVEVAWLTGARKGRERTEVLDGLEQGRVAVVIGTHALFQDEVRFAALGLVIIDEQHRFGVHQRLALREKGRSSARVPHQLVLTATPIPRTLAMTAYADLDLSVIDGLPPGRKPVTTVAVPDTRRDEVVARIREACAEGRQVYWVCTLIEESEALQCQAAADAAAMLGEALDGLQVGLVHGRLKAADKQAVMDGFTRGEIDLLVATTVIEVGVDVPNASLMVIENPERLGLAQLHQLRGRVGRGSTHSHCVLMYHPPLSVAARERLAVMRSTNDGFVIARKDLDLRGPGEVLGTRQTGELQLRIADLVRDEALLASAQQAADLMLERYPERVEPLVRRWLGRRTEYAGV